jgi:hypothetical protein
MSDLSKSLLRFIERNAGLLPLKPCLVARGYRGGGRLAGRGCGCARRRDGKCLVERWIASSSRATWGNPDTLDGLSVLAGFRPATYLRDALRALPDILLGPRRAAAHQGEFRVLTKILDPFDPLGFHFHQKDQDVWAEPERFWGERFGKDEAYYFLPGPKGAWPYTHVGFLPDISRHELIAAMIAGREALLEISPCFVQRAGMGFFVPAGLVHSPGTALTLEIQQPSDVGGGFGLRVPKDRTADPAELEAMAQQVLRHVDLELCRRQDLLSRFTLKPVPIPSPQAGVETWWIVPPQVSGKFSAKRIVAREECTYREDDCFALLAWSAEGAINGRPVKHGSEFFVSHRAAQEGLRVQPTKEGMELFAIFAG